MVEREVILKKMVVLEALVLMEHQTEVREEMSPTHSSMRVTPENPVLLALSKSIVAIQTKRR